MSYPVSNGFSNDLGASEAEKTLRLLASLPAPQGLEDRVHAGLRAAPRRARVLAWPLPLRGEWVRGAAAAAIVCVVAGGGWGIYSRVQPGQPLGGGALPNVGAPGGFSQGGAVRRPQTLVGPTLTHPAVTQQTVTPKPKTSTKPAVAATPGAKRAPASKTTASPGALVVQ